MSETRTVANARPSVELWRRFRTHRAAALAVGTLTLVAAAVLVGPAVWTVDPNLITLGQRNLPPGPAHPMGTDELGRDLLARILEGGRLTLAVALAAVVVSISLGLTVGATAGYAGGVVDNILMRLVDLFYSLPSLFVVILLVLVLGAGFWPIVIAIALFTWMNTARIVRASVLSIKEKEYVEAARSLGAGHARILLGHVLPGTLGPLVVTATLNIAFAILTESALSFLGLGFQPPQSTWGGLLFEAQRAVIAEGHWWRGFFPGLMIFIVVLSVNYIGDGLSDALDPRRRKR